MARFAKVTINGHPLEVAIIVWNENETVDIGHYDYTCQEKHYTYIRAHPRLAPNESLESRKNHRKLRPMFLALHSLEDLLI